MKRKRRKATGDGSIHPRKVLSLDAVMRLHKSGKLVEAEGAYRRLLLKSPGDPHVLYLCGVVTAQLEEPGEAIELLEEAVSHKPDHLQSISELAKLYQKTGQLEDSATALRKLIALRPDLGDLNSNLAIVLKALGEPEEATAACEKAIGMNPKCVEAYSTLGDLLKESRKFEEASAAYRKALALKPELTEVYRPLLASLRNSEKHDEAVDVLRQWLKQEPDHPIAQHMMTAYGGPDTLGRASDGYVRTVFDEFAATFEETLLGLDYQGPQLIGGAVHAEWPDGAEGLEVLDAGCGTGLCGPYLRPLAQRLVGVDLSAAMIGRARELDLYDDLIEAELTAYLNDQPLSFDLIAAADTFNYFGALEPLLIAAAHALKENGVLVYTLEEGQAEASPAGYRLNLHGRYTHHEDYVMRTMNDCGLAVSSLEAATLRMERDEPVTVLVVRARKKKG